MHTVIRRETGPNAICTILIVFVLACFDRRINLIFIYLADLRLGFSSSTSSLIQSGLINYRELSGDFFFER